MLGDVRNLACRTCGEQHRNLLDHLSGQFDILFSSPLGSTCPRHGAFVGVLGDRTLGGEPVQAVTLLGERAYLPTGPMRAAAILRCPVFFMAGLYRGKNHYHVVFEPVADFSSTPAAPRHLAVRSAIDRYAALLDQYCRSDPYNWFNFHDFWRKPGAVR